MPATAAAFPLAVVILLAGCAPRSASSVVVRFEGRDAVEVVEASEAALRWIVDHAYADVDHALAVDPGRPAAAARWSFGAFGDRLVAVRPFVHEPRTVVVQQPGEPVLVDAWTSSRITFVEPEYQSAESAVWAWIAALEHALGARAELLADAAPRGDDARREAAGTMLDALAAPPAASGSDDDA